MSGYNEALHTLPSSGGQEQYLGAVTIDNAIVDSMRMVLIALDRDMKVTRWSRFSEKVYGLKETDVLGRSILEVLPVFAGENLGKCIQAVLDTGKDYSDQSFEHVSGRSGTIYVSLKIVPIKKDGESPEGVVLFVDNVTEKVRLRKGIEKRNQLLESKNVEMESFLYMVSHDLKAPLISLQGYVTAMEDDFGKQLGEDGNFYLKRMYKNIDTMEALIHDLLELSRAGKITDQVDEINTSTLARDCIETLKGKPAAKGIEFVVAEHMPVVVYSKKRLSEILLNFVDNAIKYIGTPEHPVIEVGSRDEGDEWAFYIRDNGIGIAPEYHDKLFNMFLRVPDERSRKVDGTGIGLVIVKKIVTTNGGRVWLESEPGKGSTFYFTVPKQQPGAAGKMTGGIYHDE
ncbi:ATP-binding protein [Methanocella sp. MCL-LM]|uniref:sensor histidine kinase n=1 Tax=Methanocella sp. MCL-LM TaxID=3412035 RepID=UPI003C78530B